MKKYTTFICIISNIFGTDAETDFLNSIIEFHGEIKCTLDISGWNPPKEYIQEMGEKLQNKIVFLKEQKTIYEIERLKDFCISKEKETLILGSRIFNLNPGYLNTDGMFLLSHKPNELRGRKKLSQYWIEKQYDVKDGKYCENTNTFSEYKNDRVIQFNKMIEKPLST